jgi:TPR repeat protein
MRSAMTLISAAVAIWLSGVSGASSADVFSDRSIRGYNGHVAVERPVGGRFRPMSARAEALLGYKYEHGLGVPQSFDLAVTLYISSAERGDPTGQYLLGLMYDKGHGVLQDGVLAHMWLNLAAARASGRYREYFLRLRDAEASKMTPSQIVAAQRLAVDWVPKR